nr:dead-box atp-dependent rna helicase 16 [Quercus suber]
MWLLGKTFAYLLPLLQKLFTDSGSKNKLAPSAFVLVPTRELSQQVYTEVSSLIELCRVQLKVVQLTSSMTASDLISCSDRDKLLYILSLLKLDLVQKKVLVFTNTIDMDYRLKLFLETAAVSVLDFRYFLEEWNL